MVLTYVNRNQITSLGRKMHSNGTLNDGTKVRAQKKKEKKDYNATRQGKKRKIDRIDISGKEHFFTIRSFPISHRLARFPFHTRNNHINIGTPPHSCRDHPPFFLDNTIYSEGGKREKERNRSLKASAALPLPLSLSLRQTNYPSPSSLFLHSFLDCICSLLDIPFYWTRSLEEAFLPSFLPSWRPFLHLLLLCPGYTRGYIPPSVSFALHSFLERAPLVRDIILFRVSNFKRYYSPFREPPSANLRSFSSSISG